MFVCQVDRSGPGKKVEDFMKFADELEAEMRHQESLKTNQLFNFLTLINFDRWGTSLAFWLAILINFIMFATYTLPRDQTLENAIDARLNGCDPEANGAEGCPDVNLDHYIAYISPGWFGFIIFLGVVLTIVEGLRFSFFVSQFAKLIVVKRFKVREVPFVWDPTNQLVCARTALLTAVTLLTNTKFVSTLLLLVFGILGIFASPFFFSIHLLNVVEMSIDLRNVLRAVTLNGKSLAITAIFGVMVV
jgi:hypothetical protein